MCKRISRIAVALALIGLAPACVTINIYFPAAAAEKVADKIIDDIWQLQDTPAASKPDAEAGKETR
jgi:hypothetical protein